MLIRADAVLFIHSELENFVAYPLAEVGGRPGDDRISEEVQRDVALIMDESVTIASEHPADGVVEVTGHVVLEATARTWDRLWLASREFWG